MKISKGFIKTAFRVREKSTGRCFDCFIQDYEYANGNRESRFNIGINGWIEWNFIHYVDEEAFNRDYEIL